jgi:hypothetical protein
MVGPTRRYHRSVAVKEDERIRELLRAFGIAPQGPGDLDAVAVEVCDRAGLDDPDDGGVGEAIGGTLGAVRSVLSSLVVHEGLWAWVAGGEAPDGDQIERLLRTVAMNTPSTPPETILHAVVTTVRAAGT